MSLGGDPASDQTEAVTPRYRYLRKSDSDYRVAIGVQVMFEQLPRPEPLR